MNKKHPTSLPAELRVTSTQTPSLRRPSLTEIPSYETDVIPIEENKISKYLSIPQLQHKPKDKNHTGARIVTSHEFLAELRQKEEKKKQAEEEKRQRMLERERKKKEKEVQRQNTIKQKEKRRTQIKGKSSTKPVSTPPPPTLTTRKHTKSSEPTGSDEGVDENTCCVCFDEYHSDEEWIQCSCSRWLHEDCSLSEMPNALETCPHCVL